MQYATGADMLARYDARLLGDLASDNNVQVPPNLLLANVNMLAALSDAASQLDAAVFAGDRYTPAQLASLAGTALSLMRRLNCDLALIYMKRRRGKFDDKNDAALLKETNDAIKRLRDGDDYLMLSTDTEAQASTIEIVVPDPNSATAPYTVRRLTKNRYYPVERRNLTSGEQ